MFAAFDVSRSFAISDMMVFAVIGSSPAVGESYRTSGGSVTAARAIPTLPAHATGEFARKFVEGMLQLYKLELLLNFRHHLVGGYLHRRMIDQRISHVIRHCK